MTLSPSQRQKMTHVCSAAVNFALCVDRQRCPVGEEPSSRQVWFTIHGALLHFPGPLSPHIADSPLFRRVAEPGIMNIESHDGACLDLGVSRCEHIVDLQQEVWVNHCETSHGQ